MNQAGWTGATDRDRVDRAIVGALLGQDLSGFEIWKWLGSEEGLPGLLTEALLYPTLYRLEADGLLESDWIEGERIRRRYRLTSRAMEKAEARGWPPLAYRGERTASGLVDRAGRRTVSPDPNAGAWFVPSAADAPAAQAAPPSGPPSAAPAAPHVDDDERRPRARAMWSAVAPEPDRPGQATLAAYTDELDACLDLPRPQLNRVRQEIADHLEDSAAALEKRGYDPEAAAAEATRQLGPPRTLATNASKAQQTKSRLNRGIRRGVLTIAAELFGWLVLSGAVVVLAPTVADAVVGLGGALGLHLVVLRPGPWATNQIALMWCVGAFAAGRISIGHLARLSRHRDATLRRQWALGGGAVLLVVALLLPGYQDSLSVVTLLAIPVAFVAGTFRPNQLHERAYSVRGAAAAVLLVLGVTLLPGARLFAYDPNGTPNAPLSPAATGGLTWFQLPDGTFAYEIAVPAGGGAVTVELWPASPQGLFLVVDRSASAPAISVSPGVPSVAPTVVPAGAQAVDFSKLPTYGQWWVAAISSNSGGTRQALDVQIQTGASVHWGSVLSWLIANI